MINRKRFASKDSQSNFWDSEKQLVLLIKHLKVLLFAITPKLYDNVYMEWCKIIMHTE